MDTTYCAFISCCNDERDGEIAKKLQDAIEHFSIPRSLKKRLGRKKMGKVYRNREQPDSPETVAEHMAALGDSGWYIAVCSPGFLENPWYPGEAEHFSRKHGRERVLTVLAEEVPEERLPELLRGAPAADLRGDWKQKLPGELPRLLAPMLGVGEEELRRLTRRQQRLGQAFRLCASLLPQLLGLLTGEKKTPPPRGGGGPGR